MKKEIVAGVMATGMFIAGCGDSEVEANQQIPHSVEIASINDALPSLADLTPAHGAEFDHSVTDEEVERSLAMWRQASQEVQETLELGGGTEYVASGYCAIWETHDGNILVSNNPIVGVVNQPTPNGLDYLATPMYNYPRQTEYFNGPSALAGPYLFTSLSNQEQPEAMTTEMRNKAPSIYWLNTETATIEAFPKLVLSEVTPDNSGDYWGIRDEAGRTVSDTIFVDPDDPETENRIAALCGIRIALEEPAPNV